MTYTTSGNYTLTDEGLLVGYKLIRADLRSNADENFYYKGGEVAEARSLYPTSETWVNSLLPWRQGHWKKDIVATDETNAIYHCCTKDELEGMSYVYLRGGPQRMVKLIIHPDDLISDGRARRAYVEAISPPFRVWGQYLSELPAPATTLEAYAEKKAAELKAGVAVEEIVFPSGSGGTVGIRGTTKVTSSALADQWGQYMTNGGYSIPLTYAPFPTDSSGVVRVTSREIDLNNP